MRIIKFNMLQMSINDHCVAIKTFCTYSEYLLIPSNFWINIPHIRNQLAYQYSYFLYKYIYIQTPTQEKLLSPD